MLKKSFSRKAQLTVFFIMGFFLVGIFAFVYYMAGRAKTAELQAPTEKIIADLLKTGSIPYYVGVCLETLGEDGVTIAGRQGGDIFQDQGGTAPNPSRFIPLGDRVTYGISAPKLVNGTDYPYPPGYPGGTNKNAQVPKLNFDGWGKFGEVTLRRLCNTYGVNSPYMFTEYKETPGGAPTSGIIDMPICMFNIYTDTLSTQWQLEQYIQSRIVNCTNWTAIREETGYNVSATGAPNITFRLGLTDVWIDAYIPLELKVGNREPIYTIADFHQRLPVRLKMIMELATVMSMYDSYVLNFNLSRGYRAFDGNYDTNMKVSIDTPMLAAGIWEDVISIEDSASRINGKDFVFQFGRENRYPALDLVHRMSNLTEYDIILMENETIVIDPNKPILYTSRGTSYSPIYDPDEDNLTYYYTGWMETCNETYDFYNAMPRTACSEQEPTSPALYFKFPNQGAQISEEWKIAPDSTQAWPKWQNWLPGVNSAIFKDSTGGTAYNDVAPHAWTTSEAYLSTGRNATYTTTHEDIGPHNVTVWVCDEAGLCDYQIVRILVIDYPILRLNGSNPYKDIPHDRASVEDMYVLTTAGTTGYVIKELGLMQEFLFNDSVEPFEIYKPVADETILRLPELNLYYERDIRYIWNFTFERSRLCTNPLVSCSQQSDFKNHLLHPINLSVKNIKAIPEEFNVTVYQCLPHRSEEYPDPWPYNKTEEPYLASHTCCSVGDHYNVTIEVADNGQPGTWSKTVHNEFGTNLDKAILYDEQNNPIATKQYPLPGTLLFSTIAGYSSIISSYFGTLASGTTTPQAPDPYTIEFVEDDIKVTFTTPLDPAVGKKFTLEQTASSSVTLPPWGAWFDDQTVCYGGGVEAGALQTFEDSEIPYFPPDVGPTKKDYLLSTGAALPALYPGGPVDVPAVYRNDIWLSSFVRYCSGFRGNVCNGNAVHEFNQAKDCTPDIDISKGETESCTGPDHSTFNTPFQLTKTTTTCTDKQECVTALGSQDVICLEGICYTSPSPFNCENYHSTTYEKEWGLPSPVTGEEATGLCNPNPTCSDNPDKYKYDISKNTGKYVLSGATCENGKCSKGSTDIIDCGEFDGKATGSTGSADACNVIEPGDPNTGWPSFYSNEFICKADNGDPAQQMRKADCIPSGLPGNPDSSKKLCLACRNKFPTYITTPLANIYTSNNCCGDDAGEGGYPYGKPSIQSATFPTATSKSSPTNKGTYQTSELICDDYYGTDPTTNWIDNDCKGGANCKDNKCVSKKGPSGSYCCQPGSSTAQSSCASAISSLEKKEGMDCDSSTYECDCVKLANQANPISISYNGNNNVFCLEKSSLYPAPDRYVDVFIPQGKYQVKVTAKDLDDGTDCNDPQTGAYLDLFLWLKGNTQQPISSTGNEININSNGANYIMAFQNFADADCIINIKIKSTI
jgi:hypothetical protein